MASTINGIIFPHKKISRPVYEADLKRVYQDAEEMFKLTTKQIGNYNSFYAIAHPQCTDDDPLRFFVLSPVIIKDSWFHSNPVKTLVIINPVIINHTKQEISSVEGCASFATLPTKETTRYNKIEVEFNELEFWKDTMTNEYKPKIGRRQTVGLSGLISKIWQHEIDHLNAKYIYDL